MTHQLHLKTPFPLVVEKKLRSLHYYFLQKFNACWVVDFAGDENFAGELSHPLKLPATELKYLGALSRFEYHPGEPRQYDLLALISGPEPQRSIFEKIILDQIKTLNIKAIIVSGKPDTPFDRMISENIRHVNHLHSDALNKALLQSEIIVSRSGYTTVMDLIKLRKKAVLIPTPGQTEQEYLGKYLMEKNYFLSFGQKSFNLARALKVARDFNFIIPDIYMGQYREVVRKFIQQL